MPGGGGGAPAVFAHPDATPDATKLAPDAVAQVVLPRTADFNGYIYCYVTF